MHKLAEADERQSLKDYPHLTQEHIPRAVACSIAAPLSTSAAEAAFIARRYRSAEALRHPKATCALISPQVLTPPTRVLLSPQATASPREQYRTTSLTNASTRHSHIAALSAM